jgi:hypothetical protein
MPPSTDMSSILLTHWDVAFYAPNADPNPIAELALCALLYDRVVIRSIDVCMNRFIAHRLHTNEADFGLFRELIDHGCITILTTRPDDYADERIMETARNAPIRARAMDQFLNRSNAGEPWRPEKWQWDLCDKLDELVAHRSDHSSLRGALRPPEENVFAARFAEILRDRRRYDLGRMDQFSDIDDRIAEEFIRFCTEPLYFKRFLAGDPDASPRDAFFRHEAYQCARQFPNPHGITNLAQSVYMGLECQREEVQGRFGRKLWEPPFRFDSEEQKLGAIEQGRHIELAPRRRSIPLALKPGLGRALALTRQSTEFGQLQERFRAWETASPLEGVDHQLAALCEKFGESAAREMAPCGPLESWVSASVKMLYLVGRCLGFSFFVSPSESINPDPVVDDLASNHLARIAGEATHIVRSGAFGQGVAQQVRKALTVRSTPVQFAPQAEAEGKKRP